MSRSTLHDAQDTDTDASDAFPLSLAYLAAVADVKASEVLREDVAAALRLLAVELRSREKAACAGLSTRATLAGLS